mmetsp:Transcript_37787/g.64474  ORF Transcript_37787/g.64474 Transcript_37787/m.64474 type:complete len:304 (-) Transcript_37787:140-1051(-)
MTQMNSGVTKSHSRAARRKTHSRSRLRIPLHIPHESRQVRGALSQRVEGPYVRNGIGTLVRRPRRRRGGTSPGARRVRNCGVALQRVTQHVHAGVPRHAGWEVLHVVRIDDSQCGTERSMRDPRFAPRGHVVEDGHAGGFASGASRGGHGDQRGELPVRGYGKALSQWRIDVVVKIPGGGVVGVQIGGLGGVDGGSPSEGDYYIVRTVGGYLIGHVGNGMLKAEIVRFHPYFVVHVHGVTRRGVPFDRRHDRGIRCQLANVRIDKEEDAPGVPVIQIVADFGGGGGTEAECRGGEFADRIGGG